MDTVNKIKRVQELTAQAERIHAEAKGLRKELEESIKGPWADQYVIKLTFDSASCILVYSKAICFRYAQASIKPRAHFVIVNYKVYCVNSGPFDSEVIAELTTQLNKWLAQRPHAGGILYRAKSKVFEAFQITEESLKDDSNWPEWLLKAAIGDRDAEGTFQYMITPNFEPTDELVICAQDKWDNKKVKVGDYIIQNDLGKLEVYSEEDFEAANEKVEVPVIRTDRQGRRVMRGVKSGYSKKP